jgi:microcystin-dependent protein
MSDQFVGEIRIFACNFAPEGWAMCNGQLTSIEQNTALFSLLGIQFGGNGTTTFGLPNLQGNFAMNAGYGAGLTQRVVGETGGEANVELLIAQTPQHNHAVQCSSFAGVIGPGGAVFGSPGRGRSPAYASPSEPFASMSTSAVGSAGSNGSHNNLPPYQVLNFCIALQGIFPPRS